MRLALVVLTLSLSSLVSAQDDVTEHEFLDADDVQGHLQSSDLAMMHARTRRPRSTLISPRLNFVPELLKSAEGL